MPRNIISFETQIATYQGESVDFIWIGMDHLTPICISDKHSMPRHILIFNGKKNIFNKQVPQDITQTSSLQSFLYNRPCL